MTTKLDGWQDTKLKTVRLSWSELGRHETANCGQSKVQSHKGKENEAFGVQVVRAYQSVRVGESRVWFPASLGWMGDDNWLREMEEARRIRIEE